MGSFPLTDTTFPYCKKITISRGYNPKGFDDGQRKGNGITNPGNFTMQLEAYEIPKYQRNKAIFLA